MKNYIAIIIILIIVGFSYQSNAQYIALKGGLNLSNMLMKDNVETISSNYSNRAGFHGGLIAGIRAGFIGVEGGLLISTKGYNYDYSTEESNGDIKNYSGNRNLVYLDIPVNMKLSIGLGGNRLFATVGPVFSFGLGGKDNKIVALNDEDPIETKEKIKWGNTADDDLKSSDIGLGIGAGIDLGNITLSGNYNIGLANIAPSTDNGNEIKNQLIQFSLAFKILNR